MIGGSGSRGLKRAVAAAGTTAVLILWTGASVFGTDLSVIEKITITFKAAYGEPEEIPDPEITVNGTGCSLRGVQFQTECGNWKPGKGVRAEITVSADNGKIFPTSLNRSRCKVTGADFVSTEALDDTILQAEVNYKPITVPGATEKAGWSNSSKKKAVWKSVDYIPGHTLALYRDNKVVKRLVMESSSVNLSDYMKDTNKTYYYETKAVSTTPEQKRYLKEGTRMISADQEFDWEGYEKEEERSSGLGDRGSIKRDDYIMPNGSRTSNTWKTISGKRHYFDGNNSRVKGWLSYGGEWYYMDRNGAVRTGWVSTGSDPWFYLGPEGDMYTGQIQPMPGSWYCLNDSGYVERDWVYTGGKQYHTGQGGRMQVDRLNDDRRRHYLSQDRSMAAVPYIHLRVHETPFR